MSKPNSKTVYDTTLVRFRPGVTIAVREIARKNATRLCEILLKENMIISFIVRENRAALSTVGLIITIECHDNMARVLAVTSAGFREFQETIAFAAECEDLYY